MIKTLGIYSISIAGILCWWSFAFQSPKTFDIPSTAHSSIYTTSFPSNFHHLSPMDRLKIQQALAGDVQLMMQLISEWDVDAQILENQGIFEVHRLPRKGFVRAQILGRHLLLDTPQDLERARSLIRKPYVTDDTGRSLALNREFKKFLPQTYISASFLLALINPLQMVGIPNGMREQTQLYPQDVTNLIPLDLDRYQSEKLFNQSPEIAFVADYSLPSAVNTLRNQGIEIFTLKGMHTIEDIKEDLLRIGQIVNRPLKAELISLFMESAMMAIDNRVIAITSAQQEDPMKILFLNYYTQYSIPTKKTLTGQLLERLKMRHAEVITAASEEEWMIPITQEEIINLDPNCMILATSNPEAMRIHLTNELPLHRIKAVQNQHIHFVDDATQQTPSQYAVLAYYDLAQAIVRTITP